MELAKIKFSKLHGCGNDFIILESADLPDNFQSTSNFQKLCNRHTGIGSDGIMLIIQSQLHTDTVISRLEMYNPDGSAMGMCGNGVRCVVNYLCSNMKLEKAKFNFEVFGRQIVCQTSDCGANVQVDMGMAVIEELERTITVNDKYITGTVVSIGNPHFVIFDNSPEILDLGPKIELDNSFPDRTNVEFVKIESEESITLKVWERGAGWTQACGSGACAAAFVAHIKGFCNARSRVILPGGELSIECEQETRPNSSTHSGQQSDKISAAIRLNGPALSVYEGTWNI